MPASPAAVGAANACRCSVQPLAPAAHVAVVGGGGGADACPQNVRHMLAICPRCSMVELHGEHRTASIADRDRIKGVRGSEGGMFSGNNIVCGVSCNDWLCIYIPLLYTTSADIHVLALTVVSILCCDVQAVVVVLQGGRRSWAGQAMVWNRHAGRRQWWTPGATHQECSQL